jgi:hypothetical protein
VPAVAILRMLADDDPRDIACSAALRPRGPIEVFSHKPLK